MNRHYLQALFAPASVALVGASDRAGSLGRYVLENIQKSGFQGAIHPVNPRHNMLAGLRCVAGLGDIGSAVDLVVVTTPAAAVAQVIRDAGAAGIRNAVVLSAGFGETGPAGRLLEQQVHQAAQQSQVRLVGPNCLGIMRPSIGLNASFARSQALPGSMALVSQSGAIATALVDWACAAGVGFSSVVSMGAGIDVDFGEILDYLLHDSATQSILLYVEGIHDARRFISGLRAAARSKPIVILKAGRHLAGSRAAMSHTGALVGNDAVFDAALRRCGVVRVATYAELFFAARLIGSGRLPQGNRLAIVTNGGGPGAMAADFAADVHVELAQLGSATLNALNAVLPAPWSHGNPVDVLGDATAARLGAALAPVLADPAVDGVLTLFCPQRVLSSEDAAQAILAAAANSGKPVITGWLGEQEIAAGRDLAERGGLPIFQQPEPAVSAFAALADYRRAQQMLMQVPPPLPLNGHVDLQQAHALAAGAIAEGRTLLSEPESKALLSLFGIPVPQSRIANSLEQALQQAEDIGYPLVIKILSRDISHKSDVQGVRLNIRDRDSLQREYPALLRDVSTQRPQAHIDAVVLQPMISKRFGRELMIGLVTDAVFGPVISFGSGGVAVELLGDASLGLPPLNLLLAEDMISRTRIARLLAAYRHIPAARREDIVDVLLRVSEMACALPWLSEMDINPLLADDQGVIGLDARVVINPQRFVADGHYSRHFSHMAIHPYPPSLESEEQLADGTRLRLRPIRPEDAPMERAFVESLSDHSRYLRFFTPSRELSASMLARLTQVDYDRELALLALQPLPATSTGTDGGERMLGVARYSPNPDRDSCEFALAIGDAMQGHGIGHLLMTRLMQAAREAGYRRMNGSVLRVNDRMLTLGRTLGFRMRYAADDPTQVQLDIDLDAPLSRHH